MREGPHKIAWWQALLHAGESSTLPKECVEHIMVYVPDRDRCSVCDEGFPHLVIHMRTMYFWCIACYTQLQEEDHNFPGGTPYRAVHCCAANFTSAHMSTLANGDAYSVYGRLWDDDC